MGTISYFEREVNDEETEKPIVLEVGTTGYKSNGPQLFLKVGRHFVILSHEEAKEFCDQVSIIDRYFGYSNS
jgi:hypothetical protein